jgi:hypothetical protein
MGDITGSTGVKQSSNLMTGDDATEIGADAVKRFNEMAAQYAKNYNLNPETYNYPEFEPESGVNPNAQLKDYILENKTDFTTARDGFREDLSDPLLSDEQKKDIEALEALRQETLDILEAMGSGITNYDLIQLRDAQILAETELTY